MVRGRGLRGGARRSSAAALVGAPGLVQRSPVSEERGRLVRGRNRLGAGLRRRFWACEWWIAEISSRLERLDVGLSVYGGCRELPAALRVCRLCAVHTTWWLVALCHRHQSPQIGPVIRCRNGEMGGGDEGVASEAGVGKLNSAENSFGHRY